MKKQKIPYTKKQKILLVIFLLSLAVSLVFLGVFLYIFFSIFSSIWQAHATAEASSIGIIGGADGPTSVYVSSPAPFLGWLLFCLPPAVCLASGLWLFFSRRQSRKNAP